MSKPPRRPSASSGTPVSEDLPPGTTPGAAPPSCRALLVVGMHRSGTSAVTRALNLAGARLPSRLMPPAPDNNEEGFWEGVEVQDLHEEMLAAAGLSWSDVAPVPETWFASPAARGFEARLLELLRRDFADAPLFVVKDPRICRFIPLWRSVLGTFGAEPGFVVPVRNPLEVAGSLRKRDGLVFGQSTLLWLRHLLDAERATRGCRRSFIAYEGLLADWRATLAKIGRDLGVDWPGLTTGTAAAIDAFLSPRHRHNTAEWSELEHRPEVSAWVRAAATAALAAVERDGPEVQARFEAVDVELAAADRLYGPVLDRHDARIAELGEVVRQADLREAATQTHIANLNAIHAGERQAAAEREAAAQAHIANLEAMLAAERQAASRTHAANLEATLAAERQAAAEREAATRTHVANLEAVLAAERRAAAERQAATQAHAASLEATLAAEREAAAQRTETLHRTIAARDAELAAQQQQTADRDRMLADTRRALEATLASASWRVTAPLRWAGHRVRLVRRALRWRRHRMRLEPIAGLEARPDHWLSTDDDPQFRLVSPSGALPSGRVLVSFSGSRLDGYALHPLLYVDAGDGFSPTPLAIPASASQVPFLCHLPVPTAALRLDPMDKAGAFTLDRLEILEVGLLRFYLLRSARLLAQLARDPRRAGQRFRSAVRIWRTQGWRGVRARLGHALGHTGSYDEWILAYDTLTDADRAAIRAEIAGFAVRPTISVVMPVYNTDERWLRRAIGSVQAQLYPHWELCIADDASPRPHVRRVLEECAAADPRIRITRRDGNGHIAAASNSALALARGEFVALLDHDDELSEHALYHVARELNAHPETDLLFSDEDKIDERGRRCHPYFKSDWNPDLMLSQNAFSHLGVYRRSLVEAVGGFRPGFEGSQDLDLVLRVSERTTLARIRHIPRVLYHWRSIRGSTALAGSEKGYAWDAGRRAIAEHLERRGITAEVLPAAGGSYYRVRYPVPDPAPRVSLIVPTRDRLELLRNCLDGLLRRTDYPDLEVVIIDNDSVEPDTLAYFAEVARDPRVRVVPFHGPFNYSAINNVGARAATGTLVGLVNNDIEVIHGDWLAEMVSHAVRPEIGAVGAMLYYGDDTVQHAGVVIGLNGVAGHVHRQLPRGHAGYFGRAAVTQGLMAVTAACLLVRRELYLEVGGLDEENLRIAFNDIDFCLRLGERGYRNLWTPFAELYHLESASRGSDDTAERRPEFLKEIDYMERRWSGLLRDDPCFNPNLSLNHAIPTPAFPPRLGRPWRAQAADPANAAKSRTDGGHPS